MILYKYIHLTTAYPYNPITVSIKECGINGGLADTATRKSIINVGKSAHVKSTNYIDTIKPKAKR